jgi:hypothetical protein
VFSNPNAVKLPTSHISANTIGLDAVIAACTPPLGKVSMSCISADYSDTVAARESARGFETRYLSVTSTITEQEACNKQDNHVFRD